MRALHDEPDRQLCGAVRRRAGRARRQESDRQPGALRPDHGGAVADVEPLASDTVGVHERRRRR